MPIFVIQKHNATNLHYDFRLEINKVLKSWALPKLPPKKINLKRLAIQVPDHPLSYAKFQGTIPEGEFGAGTVKTWDSGTYKLESKKPNKIVFEVKGKKLNGKYVLIKTGYGKNKKGWLLFRTE